MTFANIRGDIDDLPIIGETYMTLANIRGDINDFTRFLE